MSNLYYCYGHLASAPVFVPATVSSSSGRISYQVPIYDLENQNLSAADCPSFFSPAGCSKVFLFMLCICICCITGILLSYVHTLTQVGCLLRHSSCARANLAAMLCPEFSSQRPCSYPMQCDKRHLLPAQRNYIPHSAQVCPILLISRVYCR